MHNSHTTMFNRHGQRRNKRRGQWSKPQPSPRPAQLTVVEQVALNRLHSGVVVWAHVPFSERDDEKTRPAVVVGRKGRMVELLPVTTSLTRFRRPHQYVEVQDLDAAGLTRASGVQRRPVTVDRIEIVSVVGELSEPDLLAVLGSPLLAPAS